MNSSVLTVCDVKGRTFRVFNLTSLLISLPSPPKQIFLALVDFCILLAMIKNSKKPSVRYPQNIADHTLALQHEFKAALNMYDDQSLPGHLVNLLRLEIAEGLERGLWQCGIQHPSSNDRARITETILVQIARSLDGTKYGGVLRERFDSLSDSFNDLAAKAGLGRKPNITKYQLQLQDELSHNSARRVSELATNDPYHCTQQELPFNRGLSLQTQAERSAYESASSQFRLTVELDDEVAEHIVGMDDAEMFNMVNRSIDSDPEVPDALKNSQWITGVKILQTQAIKVHVGTMQELKYLRLNTSWRPALRKALLARMKTFAVSMLNVRGRSMKRLMQNSKLQLIQILLSCNNTGQSNIQSADDIRGIRWEGPEPDTKCEHSSVIVVFATARQANQAIRDGLFWEHKNHACIIFPRNRSYPQYMYDTAGSSTRNLHSDRLALMKANYDSMMFHSPMSSNHNTHLRIDDIAPSVPEPIQLLNMPSHNEASILHGLPSPTSSYSITKSKRKADRTPSVDAFLKRIKIDPNDQSQVPHSHPTQIEQQTGEAETLFKYEGQRVQLEDG